MSTHVVDDRLPAHTTDDVDNMDYLAAALSQVIVPDMALCRGLTKMRAKHCDVDARGVRYVRDPEQYVRELRAAPWLPPGEEKALVAWPAAQVLNVCEIMALYTMRPSWTSCDVLFLRNPPSEVQEGARKTFWRLFRQKCRTGAHL